jgi:hypothetical protein
MVILTALTGWLESTGHAESWRDLRAQAIAAHTTKEYDRCAQLFQRAERAAFRDKRGELLYSAACCEALGGDKDRAFRDLDASVKAGWRDAEAFANDGDLAALRTDPRWSRVLARARAARAAFEKRVNLELLQLYQQDQADRTGAIDWGSVAPRDRARRDRVNEILAAHGAREAEDYYHAAMVFQHGDSIADIERARALALEATRRDAGMGEAKWLAAAAEDRALMYAGKPQRYGTQFKKIDGAWRLWSVDPAVSDEERARWNVPSLADAEKRAAAMGSGD